MALAPPPLRDTDHNSNQWKSWFRSIPARVVSSVDSPTEDNFASLDANGNVQDSGYDATSFLSITGGTLTGDLRFSGAGVGLPYGSCYGDHIGWSQAGAVQNTWYNISDADMADGNLNLVTHDGSGNLTVTYAGIYLVNYTITQEANAANVHVETGIEISGSGTANAAGVAHTENKFANEEESLSGTAILSLAASDTVEIAIRTTDAGAPNLSVHDLNITIVQIGGT